MFRDAAGRGDGGTFPGRSSGVDQVDVADQVIKRSHYAEWDPIHA